MKTVVGDGRLSKWFIEAHEDELMLLSAMSPYAMYRLCMMLALEQQLLLEKEEKSLPSKKKNV